MPYQNFKALDHLVKERYWIIAGGVALASIAGFVNVIVLGFFHVPVSHMSGAASKLGASLFSGNLSDLKIISGIMIGFFLGAVASGMAIAGSQLKPGRRYGAILIGEGATLAGAAALLVHGYSAGVILAAMACGLQNAMASSYYGLVIRTTHVTGIVTDLGVITGHWLRGHSVQSWKVVLLLGLLLGFISGGIAGTAIFSIGGVRTLWLASAACILCGAAHSAWIHLNNDRGH